VTVLVPGPGVTQSSRSQSVEMEMGHEIAPLESEAQLVWTARVSIGRCSREAFRGEMRSNTRARGRAAGRTARVEQTSDLGEGEGGFKQQLTASYFAFGLQDSGLNLWFTGCSQHGRRRQDQGPSGKPDAARRYRAWSHGQLLCVALLCFALLQQQGQRCHDVSCPAACLKCP
jgi:hypothetical protein